MLRLILLEEAPCRSFAALFSTDEPERDPGGHYYDGQWNVPDTRYNMADIKTLNRIIMKCENYDDKTFVMTICCEDTVCQSGRAESYCVLTVDGLWY